MNLETGFEILLLVIKYADSEYDIFESFICIQSTPVISKSKGPVYSFDITVFSL